MASRSVNMYLGLFGPAVWLFPQRKFIPQLIPTKHLRFSGSFPVQWTWMTCLFLNWYDINDLVKTAFLSLTHFTSALGSKIVLSSKCQQKQSSSGSTVHNYLTIGKVSKRRDFTVLWLVQKIDHWLELTSSITFIWLLVASQRTVPRSFRGKYAASFSVT